MTSRPNTTGLLGLTLLSLLGACAGPRTNPGGPPSDFAVSVAVYGGREEGASGWYVIDADGTLRAALGERGKTSAVPPTVRTLSHDELVQVWSLVGEAGVLGNQPPGPIVSDEIVLEEGDHGAIVYAAGGGRRRSVRLDGAQPPVAALVTRLRELSWATP